MDIQYPRDYTMNQLEMTYANFIESVCKMYNVPDAAAPLVKGYEALLEAQNSALMEGLLTDKAKNWIKIGIIPALLIAGQVQKVLEKHRAADEYDAVKAQVEDTLDELTTIDLRVPYDITGGHEAYYQEGPKGWHTVTPRYYGGAVQKPYDSYNDGTCGHESIDDGFANYEPRLTIEHLLQEASACASYCSDSTLKTMAKDVIDVGKRLRMQVNEYVGVVEKSFDPGWCKHFDNYEPNGAQKQLNAEKDKLKWWSDTVAKTMQEFLDKRTEIYGDAEAKRHEEYMHTDATRPEPDFKVTEDDKHCRVPFSAVRTDMYKDKDGKIHRTHLRDYSSDFVPSEDKFYKRKYPDVER